LTPEEEIIYLQDLKAYVNSRILQLQNKMRNDKRPKANHHKLSFSGLWVQASCLVPYIEDWEGSLGQLEENSGLASGTISKIKKGTTIWTREETAEKILLALDLPHVLANLEKVRIKRQVMEMPKPPESQFYEE
jgi:hypothetical protein